MGAGTGAGDEGKSVKGGAFKLPELTFGFGRRLPLTLQGEAAECGLACLAMVAGYHGYHTDLLSLRQRFAISLRGATLKGVMDIAAALGMASRPIRIELADLARVTTPCVLHWNLDHFVVLKQVLRDRRGNPTGVVIHDPARGVLKLSMDAVSASFTGIVLELTPTPGFVRARTPNRLRLRTMFAHVVGLRSGLAQLFLLALALEAFMLVSPFFLQLVVDGALVSADRDLLTMLALGFGLLMLMQTGIGLLRSWAVLYLSTHLNLQWVANVFAHLMRLPMQFFEKRHLGDVVSRFGAIQVIQRTLSTTFVEAIIDGLLAVTTLVMLLVYSAQLGAVVLASVALYALMRWCMYQPLRRASEEHISLEAREQTLFIESIRAIQAIKLFNHEEERRARWLNATGAALNRGIVAQQMNLGFTTAHTLLAGLEHIVIVYLGALLVMDGAFSVGMLYAFISYKTTFTGRVYSLVDKWTDLKMLSLQGERLADIVLAEQEDSPHPDTVASGPVAECEPQDVTIEVRDLWFRYADGEAWIIRELNLTIAMGESVALIGPSGCGKTTLLKLLLGLLQPERGEILVGGVPLARLGARNYRALIGAVMQDDHLLAGSIADNVSFFDLRCDPAWLSQCVEAAALGAEIRQMPMGLQTLIGDMGTSLSGGQKQRLLLARALYKRPRILFMDEATSHLDVAKEQEINEAISALALTRVIVAHRPETIRSAGRVIELHNGSIVRELRQAERHAGRDGGGRGS